MGAGITEGSLRTALARFVLMHPQGDTLSVLLHRPPRRYNTLFDSFSWRAVLVEINKEILPPSLLLQWTVSYS